MGSKIYFLLCVKSGWRGLYSDLFFNHKLGGNGLVEREAGKAVGDEGGEGNRGEWVRSWEGMGKRVEEKGKGAGRGGKREWRRKGRELGREGKGSGGQWV